MRVHEHEHERHAHRKRVHTMRLRARAITALLGAFALMYVQRLLAQWVDHTTMFVVVLAVAIALILLVDWVLDLVGPPLWRILKSSVRTAVAALAKDPEIVQFAERHPKLTAWLRRRLTLANPRGLYLTVTVAIALWFFSAFISIAWDVASGAAITQWDPQVSALLTAFQTPEITRFLWVFTVLGDTRVAFPLSAVAFVLLELWSHRRDALFFAASVGGGAAVNALMKLLFERPRPAMMEALIDLPGSYSFPSGHALYSMLIAFSLAFVIARDARTYRMQLGVYGAAGFFTLLTALSRVYLGVHWMSDTVAAWFLGATWLTLCIGALVTYDRYSGLGRERPASDPRNTRTWITVGVSVLAALAIVWGALADPLLAQATKPPALREWKVTLSADGAPKPTQKQVEALPRWAENMDGTPMSPIGLIFVGTESHLRSAFDRAGWQVAEHPNAANVIRGFVAAIGNQPFSTAPVTPSFMDGRVHQIAFEKEAGAATARRRHHTRWWMTNFTVRGTPVWVATASFDADVGMGPAIGVPTHRIDPDIDAEQRYIVRTLTLGGAARAASRVRVTKPTTGTNTAGDAWFTLGIATLMVPVP